MLARAATDAFAPHPKTAGLHMAAHDFNDLGFGQSSLRFDIVKARFVIPRHGDNFRCCDAAFVRAGHGRNEVIGESSFGHILYTHEPPKCVTLGLWNFAMGLVRAGL